MDGVLNFCKPLGMSSAHAVHRVRQLTGQRKSGHAGALDPLAEGVLLICLGRGTKLVEALMGQPKVYSATVRLDVTSQSFDRERPLVAVPVTRIPTAAQVREVLASFEGQSWQVPPASSALKVRGRPAYQLERAGRPPLLRPRAVEIYWIHLRSYAWPCLEIELACSRGTYVRALVRDLGNRLGTGGCLTGLVRRAVGPFVVEESWSPERLAALPDCGVAVIALAAAQAKLADRPITPPRRPDAADGSL